MGADNHLKKTAGLCKKIAKSFVKPVMGHIEPSSIPIDQSSWLSAGFATSYKARAFPLAERHARRC
jgi:hypothetical protein